MCNKLYLPAAVDYFIENEKFKHTGEAYPCSTGTHFKFYLKIDLYR
jgi:hypothetical protein